MLGSSVGASRGVGEDEKQVMNAAEYGSYHCIHETPLNITSTRTLLDEILLAEHSS